MLLCIILIQNKNKNKGIITTNKVIINLNYLICFFVESSKFVLLFILYVY